MLRTLLIEDNAAVRADLRDRLRAHSEIVVIGEADSVGRSRPLLARGDYDLVFLDVQLRGGDAFDLVPLVVPSARIVFVTAYDGYAVRAFELDALDYLLKPVSQERLAACVARATRAFAVAKAGAPRPVESAPADVVLSTEEGSQLVPARTIAAIRAQQNYTEVWLTSGQRRLVRRTLKDWEESLPRTDFARVARDALVNLAHVRRLERKGEKAACLWLTGSASPVTASNRYASSVRAALARRQAG